MWAIESADDIRTAKELTDGALPEVLCPIPHRVQHTRAKKVRKAAVGRINICAKLTSSQETMQGFVGHAGGLAMSDAIADEYSQQATI